MRSGCPRSQGGAFQQCSNVTLSSSQDINVRPLPVVHPEDEIQNNMVATHYSGDLRLAYSPAQWQQGYAQSQQNIQGAHHQQESRATIVRTGLQYPIPDDAAFVSWNSRHQISQDSNVGFYSSALHVSAQHSSYLGTVANDNALRQSVTNSGQQRKFSRQDVSFLKGSDLNSNTELQQRQRLNCYSSADSSSTALGSSCKVVAQKAPSQGQGCRVNASKLVSNPLLFSLLTAEPSDSKSCTTPPSSDDPNANIALNTQRHHWRQQAKRPLAALNWRWTGTQNPDHSDAGIYNFIQHAVTAFKTGKWETLPAFDKEGATVGQALKKDCSKGSKENMELTPMFEATGTTSASTKHSQGTLVSTVDSKHALKSEFVKSAAVDLDLSVKKHLDVTMPANGDYKLVYSDVCEDKMLARVNDERFHSKWCDKYLQNGMATLHYSSAALKELIASLEKVETFAEVENFAEVILQQYWNGNIDNVHLFASTEYPQIMREVAATFGKCKDGGPAGVPMAVRGATQDELTERQSSSPKEENVSPWLNCSNNLDDIDKVVSVSWNPKHMMDKEEGQAGLKPAQAVGWDSVQGPPAKPRSTASEPIDNTHKKYANKEKRKSVDEHHGVTSKEDIAHSELDLSLDKIQITNIVSIPANQSEWLSNGRSDEGTRKDIHSEPDYSQTGLNKALSENKDKKHASLSESREAHPQYEDISDDDTNGHCDKLSIPVYLKDPQYDDISDTECPHDEYMNVKTSPELKPSDEQSPFERNGHVRVQGQALMKTEVISHLEPISKKPVSPTTKTPEIAHHCSCSGFVGTSYGLEDVICTKCDRMTQTNYSVSHDQSFDLKDEPETDDEMDYDCLPISILDLKFEPDDDQGSPEANVESVETGDQERWCDTRTAPPKPALTIDFPQMPVYETKESFIQAMQCRSDVASGGRTPEHVMDKEGAQNRRQSVDNSDTEDSCDYSSASENNYMTASRQMLEKFAPLAPKMDVPSRKDEVSNAQTGHTKRADRLSYVEKLAKIIAKVGTSKPVQPKPNAQHISKNNQEVVIVSDTEDESEQSCVKRVKRKRKRMNKGFFSSDLEDSEDASGIVDRQCGTVKGRFQNNRRPSADSPAPSKEVMEEKCCDKHVIVIDSDTEEEEVQNCKKTRRKTFFSSHSDSEPETEDSEDGSPEETRPDQKNGTSSETEDSSDDLFLPKNKSAVDRLCGAENNRLSSEDSPEPQSVDREAESTMCANPVITRLIVVKPSSPQRKLILLKDDRLEKDGSRAPQTSIKSRKKTGFCEQNKMDSHRINMAKSGLGASKNNVQVDIAKPRKLSRQLSLTSQEGPSTSDLPSTSGQLSEARQRSFSRSLSLSGETSASSSRPTFKHSVSIPRHLPGPKLKLSHSYGASTSSSAPMHSEARQQIIKDWESNHVPTRWERKTSLGTSASRPPAGLCREARPGPSHHDKAPRKRHNSQKSETPLMKKTKIVAIQRTKDINRDASKERRCTVGEGYKWSEKPMAKPTKGHTYGSRQDERRSRSPPWPQL